MTSRRKLRNSMLGIAVLLVLSVVGLHFSGHHRAFLHWFIPVRKRLTQFVLGLIIVFILRLLVIGGETLIYDIEWAAKEVDIPAVGKSFLWHLRSAVTEELIFRGALLYIVFAHLGIKPAVLISSFAFGIYHWFSYGMFGGGIVSMVFVLVISVGIGSVWAYACLKTRSIFTALGFHVAWNFTSSLFHESIPYGQILFSGVANTTIAGWWGLIYSLLLNLVPAYLMWKTVIWYRNHLD